jgi:hypothetical protein
MRMGAGVLFSEGMHERARAAAAIANNERRRKTCSSTEQRQSKSVCAGDNGSNSTSGAPQRQEATAHVARSHTFRTSVAPLDSSIRSAVDAVLMSTLPRMRFPEKLPLLAMMDSVLSPAVADDDCTLTKLPVACPMQPQRERQQQKSVNDNTTGNECDCLHAAKSVAP